MKMVTIELVKGSPDQLQELAEMFRVLSRGRLVRKHPIVAVFLDKIQEQLESDLRAAELLHAGAPTCTFEVEVPIAFLSKDEIFTLAGFLRALVGMYRFYDYWSIIDVLQPILEALDEHVSQMMIHEDQDAL